jgi:RNA polymerase sigma-70 factor (ECF subfamily)
MTKAVRKIQSYRGEAALFTWLCVICRNELTDWQRRNASYQRHVMLIEDRPEIQAVIDACNAPIEDQPAQQFQRNEAARLIHVALDSIPAKYGNALEWMYIEGHTVREIAHKLDVSPEAAQSVLARAKRSFREVYSTLAAPLVSSAAHEQKG